MKNKVKEKIINGKDLLSEEWKQVLLDFHKSNTGVTYQIFKNFRTKGGFNSYQLISNEISSQKENPVKILDIGCGNGILSEYCLESISPISNYIGIDISEHQIELARKNNRKSKVSFKVENSEQLSFRNEEFDYVICHLAFMLLNPVESTLHEIERTLKNNGYFIAIVNSRVIKDEFLRAVMIAIMQYVSSKYPKFSLKNAGNPLTYNKKGLEVLLKDFPKLSKQIEVSEHELTSEMTAESFWQFISSSYNSFYLSVEDKNGLKELVYRMIAEKKTGRKTFDIKYSMNLYKIRKNC